MLTAWGPDRFMRARARGKKGPVHLRAERQPYISSEQSTTRWAPAEPALPEDVS